MADTIKYYEDILDAIKRLLKDKDAEAALSILEKELKAPYVPKKYLDKFENMYLDVQRQALSEEIKFKYDHLTKLEMLTLVYNGKKLDLNVFAFFLGKFYGELDDLDYSFINKIFKDPKIQNGEKIFILEQLKMCELKHEFDFVNEYTGHQGKVNSIDNFEMRTNDYFKPVCKFIEKELMKDPSLINMALDLARVIYENYFNEQPQYTINELASQLVHYVKSHFDDRIKANPTFIK
ncbi:hypothetical protein FACS1894218_0270 [Bacilli bacterium]|nr:hypothetical protein FACS1894218_0270 [Bacilli bacterium]